MMSGDETDDKPKEGKILQNKKNAEIEARIYWVYKEMLLPDLRKERKSLV